MKFDEIKKVDDETKKRAILRLFELSKQYQGVCFVCAAIRCTLRS